MSQWPDQSREANPADASNDRSPGTVVFQCQRCGGDLPPMDGDLARLARSAGGVTLAHDICPGDEPRPEGRLFEVRVQIVELTEQVIAGADVTPDVEELVRFSASLRAASLDAAMRPLAEALGEKWMAAEKQAAVADG